MGADDLRAAMEVVDDLRGQAGTVDAAQRSPDEVFWWRRHVLDTACAWDRRGSRQDGRSRARAACHRVRGVVPVGRVLLPADSKAGHWVEAQSSLLPSFPHEPHAPTAEARPEGSASAGSQAGWDAR
jgi:hypothetical protein